MRFTHTRLTQRKLFAEMLRAHVLIAVQRRAEAAERCFDNFILWRLQVVPNEGGIGACNRQVSRWGTDPKCRSHHFRVTTMLNIVGTMSNIVGTM